MSMSSQVRELAAIGKLREILASQLDPNHKMPFQKHIPIPDMWSKQEQPFIYVLIHCSKAGVTPTKAQATKMLDFLNAYIRVLDHSRDTRWTHLDQQARNIDYLKGDNIDRDWTAGTRGVAAKTWNGKIHPRRYCNPAESRKSLEKFSSVLQKLLDRISDAEKDQSLPWSVVYTGWTKVEERRAGDHRDHSGSGFSVI